ncbi:cation diffusion facilitator family transporter [Mangrovibacterium marinum]|uniref:Cobalt-zinc-cadmium efflux system protein n=1 Tax=Mangrovibacterium marinum TaxID=1639118 RepID=A0A2T5C3K7_9BACT|nr:cation diffusion facilitator family transporter [Mangrovibacterium marinum]PTN09372.1 cobalt-zinc-cadmium efflux system protein [Mangrovibacterium marinum]
MEHDHAHHHQHRHNRLGLTFLLNIVITIAQVIGGIISGSLALISDAIHNLSDGVAVLLAYIADRLGQREKTAKHSFGYKRAEILAAFINALVLIAISFYLMIEAIDRFANPQVVDFKWMLGLGILGFLANGFSVFLLHDDHHHNLNVKAAYLHLLGDALTSLAVIVGAVFIWAWGWTWIDPLVTLLISIYLLVHTFNLLKESTEILMQFAPSSIDPDEVKNSLEAVRGVKQVYHIHIWRLTDHSIHFEAHIELDADLQLSQTRDIDRQMNEILRDVFFINHVTLQFEYKHEGSGKTC